MTRRLVVDLASPRAAWRIPPAAVQTIRAALGPGWEVLQVQAPATSDGDGGSGSPEAVAAARGAEIYLGYGVPPGVVAAGRGTLRWIHTGTAGVGASLSHVAGTDIVLTNSAAVHAEPIADWTIAALAYFARGLDGMRAFQAAEHWASTELTAVPVPFREFAELRLGVFGLGGIGGAIARRGLALGMSVAGVRRRPELGGPPGANENPNDSDAWFTSFAPAGSPRVAVGVLVVKAGAGGDFAAPVAAQVLQTALRREK